MHEMRFTAGNLLFALVFLTNVVQGVGTQPVVVEVDALPLVTMSFVGSVTIAYAMPSITSVQGCVQIGNNVMQCNPAGGDLITVNGNNFGASPPIVSVGGKLCTSVLQTSGMVQQQITCFTPAVGANFLGNEVALKQSTGAGYWSQQFITLSYAQCLAGTFSLAGACHPCAPNTYTPDVGYDACIPCNAGFSSPASASTCRSCVGVSNATCGGCAAGLVSSAPGLPCQQVSFSLVYMCFSR